MQCRPFRVGPQYIVVLPVILPVLPVALLTTFYNQPQKGRYCLHENATLVFKSQTQGAINQNVFQNYGYWVVIIVGPIALYFIQSMEMLNESVRVYAAVILLVILSGLIFTRITRVIKKLGQFRNSFKSTGDLILQIILFAILAAFANSLLGLRGVGMVLIFPVAFLASVVFDVFLQKLKEFIISIQEEKRRQEQNRE